MFKFELPISKKLRKKCEEMESTIKEKDLEIIERTKELTRIQNELKWMQSHPPKFRIDEEIETFKIVGIRVEKTSIFTPELLTDILKETIFPFPFPLLPYSILEQLKEKKGKLKDKPQYKFPEPYCWVYELKLLEGYVFKDKLEITESELLKKQTSK